MLAAASLASAGDWPQWRCDANRTSATSQPGPSRPGLAWQLSLGYPDPAYDHQYRMCADISYAPVAAEGSLFVPSNATDQVVALDLESGAVRWRFPAQGPVRLSPVYYRGQVYFVCDDGYLYCVSAGDGTLRWRVRGAPDNLPALRMLVNGRMCSRWPARGAPVEHRGVIYFGAGIWPEEGVYVVAIDAQSGRVLWRSDRMSYIKNGMSDHGRPYDLSLPPQGYLAVIDGKLAVPSGRSLAAWFDPASGAMEPYTCFYVKTSPPRGTWWLSGINQYCVQGGNWFGVRPEAAPPLPADLQKATPAITWSRETPENELYVIKHRPFLNADTYRLHNENLYIEPVLTETAVYASEFTEEAKYLVPRGHTRVAFPEFDRIVARDLTRPHWTSTTAPRVSGGPKAQTPRLEFPVVWELASPLRVLLKAGQQLYAGGKDTIAAVAIPNGAEKPRIAWQAAVDGQAVHALVASGRLVVVTDSGSVYCFSDGGKSPATDDVLPSEKRPPRASPPEGYACVLGWGDGTQARRLAADNRRRVIVVEADSATAERARRELAVAGLHGLRVQIIQALPDKTLFAPYWANLVMADATDMNSLGAAEDVLSFALDMLRPYSGRLVAPDGRHAQLLRQLVAGRTGYTIAADGNSLNVLRKSPPQGSDTWTHEAGGPGNCFANSEQLVKWPLGVLWYSGDIDRYFTPARHFQHERQPYPLVVGGRMFLITGQDLHAIDIYTGSYLWKAELPLTPWVQTWLLDSRAYGRPTERNCVAAGDWVYVVIGDAVLAFDAASGRQVRRFEVPSQVRDAALASASEPQKEKYMGTQAMIQAAPLWTEVRLWDDLLLAMLGKTLVALDRHSGQVRWTRPSTLQTTTYALGGQMLFGLDCEVPKMGGDGKREDRQGLLFALNPATGEIIWQTRSKYAPVPKYEVDLPRLWLLPILPELAYNAKHSLLIMTVNRSSVQVFHAGDGAPAWSKLTPSVRDPYRVYPPTVTDDYLVLSNYKGCFGYLLDIATGAEAGQNTGIPRPRTCARIIGNNHLLLYRDAATEVYDIHANRMIGLNSLRSGCTTSFIPAEGIVTAPMLGHGCVCNYPMFASLGLYHNPALEEFRPAAVKESWVNQVDVQSASAATTVVTTAAASAPAEKVDLSKFQRINCTVENVAAGFLLSTSDSGAGYAIRPADRPLQKAVFRVSVQRAPGTHRHGNAFFVCGASDKPDQWMEFRLYYGGRRSMAIAGKCVEAVEKKATLPKTDVFTLTVTVDCAARTVALEVGESRLVATITGPLPAITHYGCGGANSDSVFSPIEVR